MSDALDAASAAVDDPDPDQHGYRVIAVDPIRDAQGNVEVRAVYRHGGAESDRIDRHWFEFGYHYLGDGRELSLGLGKWEPSSETVGALDLSVLEYVVAYFDHYGIPVDVSIPLREHEVSDFDADADLQIGPKASAEGVEQ